MTSTNAFDTVIIGAGQAGLATAYHLQRLGRECVVLDAHERVGDNWRRHWDSLRLYSPARYDSLPGMPLPGDGWAYPTKDQLADYLQSYAEKFELPVRGGMAVEEVTRDGDGDGYRVRAGGEEFTAQNVVVATGTFGRPYVPEFALELAPGIRQLHSTDYKRPEQVADGPVLVVGASHSGADIALELAATHETILCGRDTGQMPLKITNDRALWTSRRALPLMWFMANRVLTVKTPVGRKIRPMVRAHGGPLLRVKAEHLASAGVERVTERVAAVVDGKPVLDGGRVLNVANVVWATGFRPDFSWIEPAVVDDDGWPVEHLGVAGDSPGLYYMGLAFQRGFASMLVGGAGKDAELVAKHIAKRAGSRTTEPAGTR